MTLTFSLSYFTHTHTYTHSPPPLLHTTHTSKTKPTKAVYPWSNISRLSRHYATAFIFCEEKKKNIFFWKHRLYVDSLNTHNALLRLRLFIACLPRKRGKRLRPFVAGRFFFIRWQIPQNVESCLLKWQWSIKTDDVIIGQSQRPVWRWISSRPRRGRKKKRRKKMPEATPSRPRSFPAAFLRLINLHFEDRRVSLMHFYHRSLLYSTPLGKKPLHLKKKSSPLHLKPAPPPRVRGEVSNGCRSVLIPTTVPLLLSFF